MRLASRTATAGVRSGRRDRQRSGRLHVVDEQPPMRPPLPVDAAVAAVTAAAVVVAVVVVVEANDASTRGEPRPTPATRRTNVDAADSMSPTPRRSEAREAHHGAGVAGLGQVHTSRRSSR